MRGGPIKMTGEPSSGFLVFPHTNKRPASSAVTGKCYCGHLRFPTFIVTVPLPGCPRICPYIVYELTSFCILVFYLHRFPYVICFIDFSSFQAVCVELRIPTVLDMFLNNLYVELVSSALRWSVDLQSVYYFCKET